MALLTTAEAKQAIPSLTGATDDTVIDMLVLAVGAAIAAYLGYPRASATADATVESASYTLYSGSTYAAIEIAGDLLLLPVQPVTAVASVYDDPDQGYGASYLVGSSDYTTDPSSGTIRLVPTATHGGWSAAPYAVKVACTAGYSTIPSEIKLAARLTVRHWWELRSRGPSTQLSAEGVSVTPPTGDIPPQALRMLAPFRLARGFVA